METSLEDLDFSTPSLLILDNLDVIVPDEDEDRPDEHSCGLASWLCRILLHNQKYFHVAIVATCSSSHSLHKNLQSTSGSIPFRKQVNLTGPKKEEIVTLMKFFLGDESFQISDKFLSQAEGFHVSDLKRLADLSMTKASTVTSESLDREMAEFIPSSKWGQILKPKTSKTIDDVGSLHEAKSSLIQTLLWPSKYPDLFSQCGVRTPRGVMIYGAPGTGKTLLAEAVSSYTGLNMISIRGPELLSKYIGSSESNVRWVFPSN